jgi:hypothetical protein
MGVKPAQFISRAVIAVVRNGGHKKGELGLRARVGRPVSEN